MARWQQTWFQSISQPWGRDVEQRIPGLIYADDIVLLAGNVIDLQKLADICGEEATSLGLTYSTVKSGIMLFNSEENGARKQK